MGEIISKMYLYIFDIEKDVDIAYNHGYLALHEYQPIDAHARMHRIDVKRRQSCFLHSDVL